MRALVIVGVLSVVALSAHAAPNLGPLECTGEPGFEICTQRVICLGVCNIDEVTERNAACSDEKENDIDFLIGEHQNMGEDPFCEWEITDSADDQIVSASMGGMGGDDGFPVELESFSVE